VLERPFILLVISVLEEIGFGASLSPEPIVKENKEMTVSRQYFCLAWPIFSSFRKT
jgi:hypothetical protein